MAAIRAHGWWIGGQLATAVVVALVVSNVGTWITLGLYVALNLGGLWEYGRVAESWRSRLSIFRALGVVLLPTGIVSLVREPVAGPMEQVTTLGDEGVRDAFTREQARPGGP